MKRTVIILLTAVYLFSSLGVAAKSMYCMGVLTSTTIVYTDYGKEPCKMQMAKHKCCKTKKQYFKVKDQHFGSVVMAFLAKLFPVLHYYTTSDAEPAPSACQYHAYNIHAPPESSSTPVYILNCTYRIWFFFFITGYLIPDLPGGGLNQDNLSIYFLILLPWRRLSYLLLF